MRAMAVGLVLLCAVLLVLAGCGGTALGPSGPGLNGVQKLDPKTVVDPNDLRWRDISGQVYIPSFRTSFAYFNTLDSYATLDWADAGGAFSGTLAATKLKPNFAYQMKLVGKKKVTSARTPPAATKDPEGWASWQLGHSGRWWCQTDGWNVSDAELNAHIKRKHQVFGYLLFDFFVTDGTGAAPKGFVLNSTYHVLWRTDQRAPTSADSPVVSHMIWRGLWGYGLDPAQPGATVGVFAEGEPNRPAPGQVRLPAGSYPVWFNVTEESFHDNLGNTVEFGGFWAQVLEKAISFTIGTVA